MNTYTLRCSRCRVSRQFTGALDEARHQLCEPCNSHSDYTYRMTVVGHEEPPTDLSHAPAVERPYMSDGARKHIDTKARVLILSAFEEE